MQFFGHFRNEFKDDVKMYKWEKRTFLMNDLVFWSPFPIFRLDMMGGDVEEFIDAQGKPMGSLTFSEEQMGVR